MPAPHTTRFGVRSDELLNFRFVVRSDELLTKYGRSATGAERLILTPRNMVSLIFFKLNDD